MQLDRCAPCRHIAPVLRDIFVFSPGHCRYSTLDDGSTCTSRAAVASGLVRATRLCRGSCPLRTGTDCVGWRHYPLRRGLSGLHTVLRICPVSCVPQSANGLPQDLLVDVSTTCRSRPLSEGPLELPYQRPHPKCRTFHSDAIEKVIDDVVSRMKDPDLARLFENTFPVSPRPYSSVVPSATDLVLPA